MLCRLGSIFRRTYRRRFEFHQRDPGGKETATHATITAQTSMIRYWEESIGTPKHALLAHGEGFVVSALAAGDENQLFQEVGLAIRQELNGGCLSYARLLLTLLVSISFD